MIHFRNGRRIAVLALLALGSVSSARAFEALDDANLSSAVISQPDAAAFGAEAETAGEEKPAREPAVDNDRAGHQPPHFDPGPRERISLTVLRG